jgi:aminopeptidase YwaD
MKQHTDTQKAEAYIHTLCGISPHRRTGSRGNRAATDFFARTTAPWGYTLDTTPFAALDYSYERAALHFHGTAYECFISPYSLPCDVIRPLITVSTISELESCQCENSILLMKGKLCAEQLMPRNFVFYNPDHHKKIYALLDQKRPAAIITATARNLDMVGNFYPFPLFEDGDFDIPSVYCKDTVGEELAEKTGAVIHLMIEAQRTPTSACNVIASKNQGAKKKVAICAHIDARDTTPGASDNASGTAVLLLLAERLRDYTGPFGIEIIAFNGEDHYSAGGQMDYLRRFGNDLGNLRIAVNIDDVGYKTGSTSYSFYACPKALEQSARRSFKEFTDLIAGEQWVQGDHMLFAQAGIPALAFTSEKSRELMATITHTAADTPDIIDCGKLVQAAAALNLFIRGLDV